MEKQITSHILMIEPVAFGYNPETAVNNYFQQNDNPDSAQIQQQTHAEFCNMVELLREHGISIITIKDTENPHTPDSIFPNNWISFHEDGTVALYPMFAQNRREERREEILDTLKNAGYIIKKRIDYTDSEKENLFLEGTGSLILDRTNKIAYAALSERTDSNLFRKFCADFEYQPIAFSSFQSVNNKRLPIYHTNVMMCVAEDFAVVCLDTIDDLDERAKVVATLTNSGKKIIEITEVQMQQFAGNMLQVANSDGIHYLIMSKAAFDSLEEFQIQTLSKYNEIIAVPIPTIEKYGGGSVRCMMAELFNI